MKTPFQNYILNVLQEQAEPTPRPISLSDFAKDKPSVDDFSDLLNKPVDDLDVDDVEGDDVDDDGDDVSPDNENPPEIPNGLTPVDEDGDGQIDYYVDAAGNQYTIQWVRFTVNGEDQIGLMFVYTENGFTFGYVNGKWQLIMPDANGNPFLYPNLWIHRHPITGAIQWIYENPDQPGQYWVTTGNPYDPNTVWTNPATGGTQAGEGVYYDPGLGIWVNIYIDGMPPFGVPVLPGGSQATGVPGQGPGSQSGNGISINIGGTFGGLGGPYSPEAQAHRRAWNTWVYWWNDTFGDWPPESTWPQNTNWWDMWTDGHEGPWS